MRSVNAIGKPFPTRQDESKVSIVSECPTTLEAEGECREVLDAMANPTP
jgi:hypothetical protein